MTIEIGILRPNDWPALHRNLREAGIRPSLLPGDPAGAGAKWRAHTVKAVDASWGRALHFAVQMGWQDVDEAPEAIASPIRLKAYLEHLGEHNKPVTVLHRIIGLERALAILAPKFNRKLLRLLIANMEDDYEPQSKRDRLQESAALFELGVRLMRLAFEMPGVSARRRETMYRDGLMIALLASRPVRIKNLTEMRFGPDGHLYPNGTSFGMRWQAHEVKNNKPIDVDFPEALIPAMHEYLNVHRPVICDGKYFGDALWVSYMWQPLGESTIRQKFNKWTMDAFGLPVTPHLFRDAAATSLAVHSPGEVEIAHLILGNTYAVMQKHYNLAKVIDAGSRYNAALDKMRRSLASE